VNRKTELQYTLSVPKYKAYKYSQKLTPSMFDQVYTNKYEHLPYEININRLTIKDISQCGYLIL
jgi:hypothetical protein